MIEIYDVGEGVFVASNDTGRLPGLYDSAETAAEASALTPFELEGLADSHELITMDDLRPYLKAEPT